MIIAILLHLIYNCIKVFVIIWRYNQNEHYFRHLPFSQEFAVIK